tara:strand:- start:94 stop:711 length:618 start_codon:yes stop_codon:yes gene_type:complete
MWKPMWKMQKGILMGKTFNPEEWSSYTEFLAFNITENYDINDIRDSDNNTTLIKKFNASSPPDGLFRCYWENGNLRYEWYYKDGKQHGVSIGWWPNGDLKAVKNYKNGVSHGQHKAWYENGAPGVVHDWQVGGIRYFENGVRHGTWIEYHPNGQKWCVKIYKSGKMILERYWKDNGEAVPPDAGRRAHKRGELKYYRKICPTFSY